MQSTTSLRHVLSIFFKYRRSTLSVLLATLATVAVVSFVIPPTYESSTTILVNFGREYIYLPEVGNARSPYNYYNQTAVINTEIEILSSRDLIETVIKAIGVNQLYPKLSSSASSEESLMSDAIKQFRKNLSVRGSHESNIIRASFRHTDAAMSARTANLLVDLFKEKHLQTFGDSRAYGFLEEKAEEYRSLLDQSQNRYREFKGRYLAYAVEDQEELLLQQRAKLSSELKGAGRDISVLTKRLQSVTGEMKSMSESVPIFEETYDADQSRTIPNIKAELLSLQLKELELLDKFKDSHAKVQNVRRGIRLVEKYLEEQQKERKGTVRTGRSVVYQELEKEVILLRAQLLSQQAKSAIIVQQLDQVDEDLRAYSVSEKELTDLKRELAVNEQNFKTYQGKVEEMRISDEMDQQKMTNIRVVQMAAVPTDPIQPKILLNLIVGLGLGLFAGLGLAFLKEYLSQTMNSPDVVEKRLGLPVLATVGYKTSH